MTLVISNRGHSIGISVDLPKTCRCDQEPTEIIKGVFFVLESKLAQSPLYK